MVSSVFVSWALRFVIRPCVRLLSRLFFQAFTLNRYELSVSLTSAASEKPEVWLRTSQIGTLPAAVSLKPARLLKLPPPYSMCTQAWRGTSHFNILTLAQSLYRAVSRSGLVGGVSKWCSSSKPLWSHLASDLLCTLFYFCSSTLSSNYNPNYIWGLIALGTKTQITVSNCFMFKIKQILEE